MTRSRETIDRLWSQLSLTTHCELQSAASYTAPLTESTEARDACESDETASCWVSIITAHREVHDARVMDSICECGGISLRALCLSRGVAPGAILDKVADALDEPWDRLQACAERTAEGGHRI